MSNRGVAPADLSTEVGQLRDALGDLNYTELDPAESGFGDYDWFSDSELEQLLLSSDDNMHRATGYGLRKLARYLTMSATDIATDDLRIKTIERAKLMRQLAEDELATADLEDAAVANGIFDVIPFAGATRSVYPADTPQLEPDPVPEEDNWVINDDGYLVNG